MNTEFTINNQQFQLKRFPEWHDVNLQAWDAADEYLLSHLDELDLPADSSILILNDSFGALACGLHPYRLAWYSDSYVSCQATRQNLEANELAPSIEWPETLPDTRLRPDVVVLKVPKSNALLEAQLAQLSPLLHDDTLVVAAGRTRDIHTSTLKLFERCLGPTKTSLARKKARLIFCQPDGRRTDAPAPLCWSLDNTDYTVVNHSGVFSRAQLDIGARLMLSNLPGNGDYQHIIDLGCGNGVLGLQAATRFPEAAVTLVDESRLAVDSARDTLSRNLPERQGLTFAWNNCLDGFERQSADLVLCNPPFHQQQAITDHIAWQMFVDAHRTLRRGGMLQIVGNRHLGYHLKLKRLFGNCQTVASNKKFVILTATKQ